MDIILFALKTAGIGLLTGVAIGYLSKKISKLLIFLIALAFIFLQVAIYNNYIHVDWLSWKDTAVEVVKQTEIPTSSIRDIIFRNIPFSISALVGFIFGFKKG